MAKPEPWMWILAGILLSSPSWADPPRTAGSPAPAGNPTAPRASKSPSSYLDEIARLDEKIAIARKQEELRQARGAGTRSMLPGQNETPPPLPRVLSIHGSDTLSAEIVYGTGLVVRVRAGDEAPNGLSVATVTDRNVVVMPDARTRITLEHAARDSAGKLIGAAERPATPPLTPPGLPGYPPGLPGQPAAHAGAGIVPAPPGPPRR